MEIDYVEVAMNGKQADPRQTYALIVGIEQYAAGSHWDLNGPASDACRFADWLCSCGVSQTNITLLVSPLEANKHLLTMAAPQAEPATHENIYCTITETLPQKQGDLLYVFWGGHGILTADRTRKLFYSEATQENIRNLDLVSLLTYLRTDAFSGLQRQICIVDACANYVENWQVGKTVPGETFAIGQPLLSNEQFVLLAARAGDLAKNLDREMTGLFSKEFFGKLSTLGCDAWPPDMGKVAHHLEERFSMLRNEGLTEQTPNFYWYRDWAGNEGALGNPIGTNLLALSSKPTLSRTRRNLSIIEKHQLITVLLACPTISDPNQREAVIQQLRSEVATRIPRDRTPRVDVLNIVTTCLNFSGGFKELIDVVRFFEGPSLQMEQLLEVVQHLSLVG